MTDTIERMARGGMRERLEQAVRDCAFLAGVDLSSGDVTIEDRIVNVILSALEEPSEAQLYAAHKAAKPYFDRGETVHAIRHALQAMIRTAKGGEG